MPVPGAPIKGRRRRAEGERGVNKGGEDGKWLAKTGGMGGGGGGENKANATKRKTG